MMEDYIDFVEADILLSENSKVSSSVECVLSFVSNIQTHTHKHTVCIYPKISLERYIKIVFLLNCTHVLPFKKKMRHQLSNGEQGWEGRRFLRKPAQSPELRVCPVTAQSFHRRWQGDNNSEMSPMLWLHLYHLWRPRPVLAVIPPVPSRGKHRHTKVLVPNFKHPF